MYVGKKKMDSIQLKLLQDTMKLEYQTLVNEPHAHVTRVLRGSNLAEYVKGKRLSPLQRSVLVGLLLGDGSLLYNGGRRPFLKFDQKYLSLPYVDFIYGVFQDMVGTPPKLRRKHGEPHSYWFRTFRYDILDYYARQFYEIDALGARKRVVPKNIHQLLDPIALAVWFMDDGGTEASGYRLHTECFTLGDVTILQKALGSVFSCQANIRKDNRGHGQEAAGTGTLYYLYIPAKSVELFNSIVSPYVLDIFRYKLDLRK